MAVAESRKIDGYFAFLHILCWLNMFGLGKLIVDAMYI